MPQLRYVKTPEQLRKAAENNPEFLQSTVSSVRAVYETDSEVAAAVVPQPLEPAERPEVGLVVSKVKIHLTPEVTFEIGAGTFGVKAVYEGVEGLYLVTMPMTAEMAVIGGRETYGEPKKIADIDFSCDGERVSASITRNGVTYIEVRGALGDALPPREYTEHAYCYKALPSCEPDKAFDVDPLLVRLEWRQKHETVRRVDGEVLLYDSPFDPVVDLPVRRLVSMEYDEGTSQSNGRVLRSVPGDWLVPYLHQRYDELGL